MCVCVCVCTQMAVRCLLCLNDVSDDTNVPVFLLYQTKVVRVVALHELH